MPSNIERVIDDIGDVKDDLENNVHSRVGSSMRTLHDTVVLFIEEDADYTGDLRRSIYVDTRRSEGKIVGTVGTDPDIAPYAPFVEFGTGKNNLRTAPRAQSKAARPPADDATLAGYPFSAPAASGGLVSSIIDWVENKPIIPDNPNMTQQQLGYVIAAQIIEEGTHAHPFLQPAWFRHEPLIYNNVKNGVRKAFN